MTHDRNRERTKAELAILGRLRPICAKLPGVTEDRDGFGHTTLKVGKTSFLILGQHADVPSLAIKTDRDTQAALIKRGGYYRTPYIGQHGWISVDGTVRELDFAEIEELATDTWRAVAPKKLVKQFDEDAT